MNVMEYLRQKATAKCPRLLFVEGENAAILEAAYQVQKQGIARPVVLCQNPISDQQGIDLSNIEVINVAEQKEKIKKYAAAYEVRESFPAEAVEPMLKDPLNFGAMMLAEGDVDGMIAGFVYTTADVINSSQMFVGLAEGVAIASSYFIMDIPNWKGGENGLIIYADGGVVPNPDYEELASITITTADSATRLLNWEPRVAMLSFSTKGSAKHDDVDKVVSAFNLVKELRPELKVDGELQADAALDSNVAAKKVGPDNVLQGMANILIFPDLDAGNIAYKLTQRLTGGQAYGPLLQGYAKPVSDLSRGASVDDIIGVAIIVAAQA